MSREDNVKIFEDTVQRYHTDKDLIDAIYDGPYSNNYEVFKKVFELS